MRSARGLALPLLVALAAAIVPVPALAQPAAQPPLKATLFFRDPPANILYDATSPETPVKLGLRIENVTAAAVNTTEGFSRSEFWRRLVFTNPDGGLVINTQEAAIHIDARLGFCFSRQGTLQSPTAIPVAPVESLAGPPTPFLLEYTIDDARRFFDLTRPGRYTVEARIELLQFLGGGSIIDDCDQFPGTTLVDVGASALGRVGHTIVSNQLEFGIRSGDSTPPVTTLASTPLPNAAGWNNQNVTLTFTAADDAGPANVSRIVVTTSGAQPGEQVIPGASGAVTISAEGLTTVTFHAEDLAGNAEAPQTAVVRLDKTAPSISLTPGSGPFLLNQTITINYGASDGGSGLAGQPQGTLTPPGGSPTPIASPSAVTLNKVGTAVANVTARDVADNIGTRTASYSVRYRFVGFGAPVGSEQRCGSSPCATFKIDSAVPLTFQLFDGLNAVVTAARATASVTQVSGSPPPQPPTDLSVTRDGNNFRFDANKNQYVFVLNARVLAPGVWRVSANLDDGTVHSVLIRLR